MKLLVENHQNFNLVNPDEISQIHSGFHSFTGGKFGLPLVDVYGKLLERPSEAAVKAARDALPKNDQVGSEGRSQEWGKLWMTLPRKMVISWGFSLDFTYDFHQKYDDFRRDFQVFCCGYTSINVSLMWHLKRED